MEFLIDGYWKDDKTKFTNYIVSSKQADIDDDDNIFYYDFDEEDIIQAIEDGENTLIEFVITSYTNYSTLK